MAIQDYLFVGAYTRPAPYLAETNGEGIYIFKYDSSRGVLERVGESFTLDNPSYMSFDPSGTHLYANNEVMEWPEGVVNAYAIDPESGQLTYLNKQSSMGWLAAYISVERTGRWALVANYMGGNIAMFPIEADGKLGPASHVVRHEGSGVDPARQEGPHCHCIVVDPTNQFAFVADLGLDKIVSYKLDLENGKFIPNGAVTLPPGSGPRHFVFHPNGKYAYSINELASTLAAYAYDDANGALEFLHMVPALPADFAGESHCADIHVHPNGRFLYGSNRGHDSIVIYGIDESTGRLSYIGHESTRGRTPRNFMIDANGVYLLAANQDSDNIVVFRIDQEKGTLAATGHVVDCPTPVCLKMLGAW